MQPSTLPTFLAYYDAAHRNATNRCIHHTAHSVAVIGGILLIWNGSLGIALIASTLPLSWAGHVIFERNTPAFFDAPKARGFLAALQKLKVALGGIVWSGACLLRLIHRGPLVRTSGS